MRVGELVAGDTVLVKTGGQIPSDGIVLGNAVTVNESAITGESVPVVKMPGSGVIGGTVVSQGVLTMEVEKVGADTVLAGIIKMVREAQETSRRCNGLRMRQCGILFRSCWVLRFWRLCTGSSLRGRRF